MEICREFHNDRDIADADHPAPMNVYAHGGLLPEVVLEAGGEWGIVSGWVDDHFRAVF